MSATTPTTPTTTRRPSTGDAAIGVVLAGGMLVGGASGGLLPGPAGTLDAGAVALAVLVAVAVGLRRRMPLMVLLVTNILTAAWYLLEYPGRLVTLAALIGCYTLAAERGWRWGVA
ncbi:MAG: hypothetical protein L0H79_07735, partial [Intrasporangium sp.]|uniref:DUF7134 domain-containing protein n=1 Tax=Intrasporangium sp. TaxID=1925024 RepID=UPI0026474717